MKLDWKTCFRVGLSIFILYLCIHYIDSAQYLILAVLGAASPLIIGSCMAYVVNIPMSFYERHYFSKTQNSFLIKSRRPVCMLLAFITVIAIITLVVSLIIPQLVACIQLIISGITIAINLIVDNIDNLEFIPENVLYMLSHIDWQSHLLKIINSFTAGVGNVLNFLLQAVTYIFSVVVSIILSTIFSIYLLSSKDKLKVHFNKLMGRYLKPGLCEKIRHYLFVINDSFHDYIVGQCVEAVILGALCTLGMYLLGLPHATTIGALVAFTALIPIAGAYIGAFVGAFILVTGTPIDAVVFLIFIIILQQIEGNVIYPKVVGESLGLPGIWVLAAVTIGGGILGIPGMLFGVPLAAALYRLLREDVNRKPQRIE